MSTENADDNDSDGVECPTCGDDFASERAMRSHRTQVHNNQPYQDRETLRRLYVEEEMSTREIADKLGCSRHTVTHHLDKNDIETRDSPSDKTPPELREKQYLQREYAGNGRAMESIADELECPVYSIQYWLDKHGIESRAPGSLTGEEHPNWKGGEVEVTCVWCNSTLLRKRHAAESNTRFYCDDDCRGEWQSENWAGEDNPGYKQRIAVQCEECGGSREVRPSRVRERNFCSVGCLTEWKTTHQSGEDHPSWKGGQFPYGPGFNERKKREVRERDNYVCQDPGCDMTQEEHLEMHGCKLPVHHIQKARSFDDPEDRNAMKNLIALCSECHPRWERMAPLRPEPVE